MTAKSNVKTTFIERRVRSQPNSCWHVTQLDLCETSFALGKATPMFCSPQLVVNEAGPFQCAAVHLGHPCQSSGNLSAPVFCPNITWASVADVHLTMKLYIYHKQVSLFL